ncbi:YceI family protein [Leptolyngbya sp. 15MV]|nr:YceI family protein [Leptolyngbya sp. 15MV]
MSGGIALSPDAPGRIDLNITLDARSLTASDDVTLSRLKGPDFFSVDRYPTIPFIGRDMTMRGDQQAVVDGELTARGATRPARLTVRFERPPMPVRPDQPLSLTATTVIDRRDFGMTAYPLIVGRNVTISIRARMVPAQGQT